MHVILEKVLTPEQVARVKKLVMAEAFTDGSSTSTVARAVLKDGAMSDVKDVFVGENLHGATSILVTADKKLWIATSGEGSAQDTKTLAGKVIRLNLPIPTEERRRELVKKVHARLEEARVAVRNVRRDLIKDLREFEKEKMIV